MGLGYKAKVTLGVSVLVQWGPLILDLFFKNYYIKNYGRYLEITTRDQVAEILTADHYLQSLNKTQVQPRKTPQFAPQRSNFKAAFCAQFKAL